MPRFNGTVSFRERDEEKWTEEDISTSTTDVEFFAQNIDENRSSIPLIIVGEAGMGKTITMHQFGLKYVQEIENRLFDLNFR